MNRLFENHAVAVVAGVLFLLAIGFNAYLGGAVPALHTGLTLDSVQDSRVLIGSVAHGPTFPPDPWDTVSIAHGPTFPPDPWETVSIAHGPTFPPDPWETLL